MSKVSQRPEATALSDDDILYVIQAGESRRASALAVKSLVLAERRVHLDSDAVFYVSPSGNDISGDGSVSAPWRSPQKAYDWIVENVDFKGHRVTISLADGTYTGTSQGTSEPAFDWGAPIVLYLSQAWTGGGELYVEGNRSTPANVNFNTNGGYGVIAEVGNVGHIVIAGIGFTGGYIEAVRAANCGTQVTVDALYFGAGRVAGRSRALMASDNGFVFCYAGSLTFAGNVTNGVEANSARVNIEQATITFTGTPAFSGGFLLASYGGSLIYQGITVNGSATGPRFSVFDNGHISALDGSFEYLSESLIPGNAGGSFKFGGSFNDRKGVRDLVHSLSASVTPSNNGELMVQATSNTSLTFKYKGSDGVVRSGSITLS